MMLLNGALRLSLLVTMFTGRALGGIFPQNKRGPMSDAGKNGAVASEANDCTKAGKMMFAAGVSPRVFGPQLSHSISTLTNAVS